MSSILEVKDLTVYYGVIKALKGISFHVDKGEIVALIGANGAGKTTTLHTLSGLISADGGSINYKDMSLPRSRAIRSLPLEWPRCLREGACSPR